MISYCMVDWPGRPRDQAMLSALDAPECAIARAGMKRASASRITSTSSRLTIW